MELQVTCETFKCGLASYVIIGVEIWEEDSLQSSFPPNGLRLLTILTSPFTKTTFRCAVNSLKRMNKNNVEEKA